MKIHIILALAALMFVAFAAQAAGIGDNLASYDTNKDGMIGLEELRFARKAQFDKLDRNPDGAITDADMPAIMRGVKGAQFQTFMQTFDANGDKRVTRDEFVNGPTPAFDQADSDNNGVVDAAELKAFRSQN